MPDDVRPVTIYDVAKLAGVSASTLSPTFARPGGVGYETAARVRAVAKELCYRTVDLQARVTDRRDRHQAIALSSPILSIPSSWTSFTG